MDKSKSSSSSSKKKIAKPEESDKMGITFKRVILVLIIILIILAALSLVVWDWKGGEKNIKYRYSFSITIEGPLSNVTLKIPLADDREILEDINKDLPEIQNTDYGKVAVLNLNSSKGLNMQSSVFDTDHELDTDIRFSTQKGNKVYVYLENNNPDTEVYIEILISRQYERDDLSSIFAGKMSYTKYFKYIVIGGENYNLGNPFISNADPKENRHPYKVTNSWNEIEIQKGNYEQDFS